METALRRKDYDRLRKARESFSEARVYIASPRLEEAATVSLTPEKILRKHLEHGPEPVVVNYWRKERGRQISVNFKTEKEMEDWIHGN